MPVRQPTPPDPQTHADLKSLFHRAFSVFLDQPEEHEILNRAVIQMSDGEWRRISLQLNRIWKIVVEAGKERIPWWQKFGPRGR